MFILGTICCREGSKGIPGKNFCHLNGRPLLDYTIETAKRCRSIDAIILSTDSASMARHARECNITVPFLRPAELSSDTASKWDVFRHAVHIFEAENEILIDYVVDMDVTVPLKTADDIEGAIQTALSDQLIDVVITAYEPERNPYFNMMELDGQGRATVVKSCGETIACRQQSPNVFSLSPAAYVIKRSALFEFSHWSHAYCKLYIMPRKRAVDIDTLDDLRYIKFLMSDDKSTTF